MDPVSRHVSSPQLARMNRGVYVRSDLIASLASRVQVAAIDFRISNRASLDAASTFTKYKRFVARPSTVPVVVIVFAAVGGAVVLALILTLIYALRVRRRVSNLRRTMDVLGPGASLNSVALGLPRRVC
jgi:ABC-type sugar transport system permease subunit